MYIMLFLKADALILDLTCKFKLHVHEVLRLDLHKANNDQLHVLV